jgi:hypothetical protein
MPAVPSVFVNNLHFGKFQFHLKQDTFPDLSQEWRGEGNPSLIFEGG